MAGVTKNSSGKYIYSCSKYLSTLPSIWVKFGGFWIEIQGSDYANVLSND